MLTPEEEARKAKLLQELKDLEDGARRRFWDAGKKRRYRFADIKKPEDLATARRFQQVFGRHMPHLLEDEHATVVLHQWLLDGLFGNPIRTINKSTFEADLKRFKAAIKVLAEWRVWGEIFDRVEGLYKARDNDSVWRAAREIYDCLLTIDDMAHYDEKLPQVLDQLETWAREGAEDLPDRRNINWQAVNAVDRFRGYWENVNETPAPRRALNPASPFADYLRDAFEFFNISGDPIAAFKRWVIAEDAMRGIRIRKWK